MPAENSYRKVLPNGEQGKVGRIPLVMTSTQDRGSIDSSLCNMLIKITCLSLQNAATVSVVLFGSAIYSIAMSQQFQEFELRIVTMLCSGWERREEVGVGRIDTSCTCHGSISLEHGVVRVDLGHSLPSKRRLQ